MIGSGDKVVNKKGRRTIFEVISNIGDGWLLVDDGLCRRTLRESTVELLEE